jgi:hypothetical protein
MTISVDYQVLVDSQYLNSITNLQHQANYIFTNPSNVQNKLSDIKLSLDGQNKTLLKAEIPENSSKFQSKPVFIKI